MIENGILWRSSAHLSCPWLKKLSQCIVVLCTIYVVKQQFRRQQRAHASKLHDPHISHNYQQSSGSNHGGSGSCKNWWRLLATRALLAPASCENANQYNPASAHLFAKPSE